MKIRFAKSGTKIPAAVAVVYTKGRLSTEAQRLDQNCDGLISQAIASGRFQGRCAEHIALALPKGAPFSQVLLIGAGDPKGMVANDATKAGAALYKAVDALGWRDVVLLPADDGSLSAERWGRYVAVGVLSSSYRFDRYRTQIKTRDKPIFSLFEIVSDDPSLSLQKWERHLHVMDGVFLTRDLVSEPSNVLTPVAFAERIKALKDVGVEVEILDLPQLRKLKMGALINVGRGSENEPRVAIMRWRGAKQDAPLAFIGKGVTFDTGGISLKPAGGMEEMKTDMSGAAVVTGLLYALAARKAPVDVVGVVGLAENMPSGTAQKPGDIITAMSGTTIEVRNTDAEGRLVLADVLWYTKERFAPRFMIDLATLTGAIVAALGEEYAGLFSEDKTLSARLQDAGKATGERVWPFPLDPVYDKMIDSKVADIQNITGRGGAGSITAAHFLQRFTGKTPWVHLDIAGVSFRKDAREMIPAGASGFGVRLLDRMIADHYE